MIGAVSHLLSSACLSIGAQPGLQRAHRHPERYRPLCSQLRVALLNPPAAYAPV